MRLSHETYVDHVRSEAARIAEIGVRGLDPAVPSCPGWTVRDAIEHTAVVYQHKVACMRDKARPDPWPPQRDDEPTLDYFKRSSALLVNELTSRDPLEFAETWWWDERTVGFWGRRMAHESLIHRVDVELAHDDVSGVDSALALDGVDEVLRLMVAGDWSDEPHRDYPSAVVRIVADDADGELGTGVWRVVLEPMAVSAIVETEQVYPVDATLRGDSASLDLWLWRRGPDTALRVDGDEQAVEHLHARMHQATQ